MAPATEKLARGVLAGERVSLSRSITLVESTNPEHGKQAELLLDFVLKHRTTSAAESFRVGITGPPGAGKSTFVEALGSKLVDEHEKRLAVIAVDPSSTRTHGSILGDKTRMDYLSQHPQAFIRPSPTKGRLGGIAQHTNEVVLLCEAAGYNMVFVETVGLGQSEIAVDECVDMLLLVVPPASGDELQGVKKGIMEVADMVVVNKADGPLQALARNAAVDYTHALSLTRRKRKGWRPRVRQCSARERHNLDKVYETIEKFQVDIGQEQILASRAAQAQSWMWTEFQDELARKAGEDSQVLSRQQELVQDLRLERMSPRVAAHLLVDDFLVRRED